MIRRIFIQISNGLAALFEGGVQEKDIKLFCLNEYKRITAIHDKPAGVEGDLRKIEKLLEALGWLGNERLFGGHENETDNMTDADLQRWITFLEEHYIFEKGIIAAGSSRYMDFIDEIYGKKNQRLIKNNLERILRHVEVRRKNSLSIFSVGLSHDQMWLERFDTSILFSRYARRHNDLRFLNAAYKLDDWFFEKNEGRKTLECQARFVLALCEQESSSMELLK